MKKALSIFLLLLVSFSSLVYAENSDSFQQEVNELKRVVDRTTTWRKRILKIFHEMDKLTVLEGRNLTSREVKHMQAQVDYYKDLREKIIPFYQMNYDYSLSTTSLKLTKGESRVDNWLGITYRLNPNDSVGRYHIKKIKIGLIASLLLYDNYVLIISQLEEIGKLRRLANSDASISNYIRSIGTEFVDLDNYKHLRRVLDYVLKVVQVEKSQAVKLDSVDTYLDSVLNEGFLYNNSDEISYAKMLSLKLRYSSHDAMDITSNVAGSALFSISKIFGNGVGRFQSRSGYLKSMSHEEMQRLSSKLMPLDILLEKTPFRLTDKFIPGHWGHVAIWTGSEAQLKSMKLWNHPIIIPYHQQIREGKRIIEALRPGVQLNSLEHFLDIDDFTAIRKIDLKSSDARKFLLRAFRQIGKEYDFSFDVETDTKIVCSELAYVTYYDYDWKVDLSLGRYTISPDNVAEKVRSDEFYPVVIYHDGKEITRDLKVNFEHLLDTNYQAVKF